MKNFKRLVAVAMAFALTASAFTGVAYANRYVLQQVEVNWVNVAGQRLPQMGLTKKAYHQGIWAVRPGQSSSLGNNGGKATYEFSKSPFYWTLYGSATEHITLKSHHRPNSGYSVVLEPGEFVWAPSVNRDTATCPKGTVDCTFVSYSDLPNDSLGRQITPERCGFTTEMPDNNLGFYLEANGYRRVAWGVYKNNAGEYANVIPKDLVDEWARANGREVK